MGIDDMRRRLPVVNSLPVSDRRTVKSTEPGTVPGPRLAVWELTLACDQRCIHCGSRAGPRRPGELSTEEALALVDELRSLGVGEVTLVGGEAYLRNDFILVIRAIREAGMACTLTTGGLNLGPARCAAMAEAGIGSVNLSIDGMQRAHDRLRGVPGSWSAAFAALDNLRAAGIRRSVNTQINRLTRDDLHPLLEQLISTGIRGWQLQITAPFGNAADHPEILLQPYDYPDLFESLDALADRCAESGIVIWPANNLGYFGPFEAKLRRFQKRGAHYKGCGAGRTTIGIEADGRIKGCPSLGGPENEAGRWSPGTLREMWERSHALHYTRQRTTDVLWGYCAECYYASVCMGGCTATSEPLLGRPGNNPFCHHRALELAKRGLRERIEMVRAAPGAPFDHALYRIICEPIDPERRAREGPMLIDEPRNSRTEDAYTAGHPVTHGGAT